MIFVTIFKMFFGMFLKCIELRPRSSGEPGDPSRIVHVSSYLQFEAKRITSDFDLDSFPSEKPTMQYGYSKLLINLNCRAVFILIEFLRSVL